MKRIILGIAIILFCGFFFFQKRKQDEAVSVKNPNIVNNVNKRVDAKSDQAVSKGSTVAPAPVKHVPATTQVLVKTPEKKVAVISNAEAQLIYFVDDDGLAVIQGDIVLGQAPNQLMSGPAAEPTLQLWPSGEIPFYIQPTLPNPERVIDALGFFSQTSIRFVRLTNQTDAIVFEPGLGTCKSYLGRVGGHQPIWISGDCSAKEIGHEIMHALGFVHEQNRTDRDNFIQVSWENIEANHKLNFEKFSKSLTRVTEMAPFDFESLMMYPDNMFSLNGRPTMKSLLENRRIAPASQLSANDVIRINSVY